MAQKKPSFDPTLEDQKLDLHAKNLNDTVLISQAYHALSTTLRKHHIDITALADVYYPLYLQFCKKCTLNYENTNPIVGQQA